MLKEIQPIASGLEAADRSFQKEKGSSFLLRAVPYLFGLILFCFVLDVFLHLGAGTRLGLLIFLAVVFLAIFAWGYYVAYVRRNQMERIARLLETHDPALGSRLINVLQLQSQTSDPALSALTRDLAGQAVTSYASELRGINFRALAKSGRLSKDLKRTAFIGLAFVALLGVFYKVTGIEMLRFADPFGDHPPYSFTQLKVIDPGENGVEVTYNKNFVVKVKHSGHRPRELFLTFHPPGHPEQAKTVPMFDKGELGYFQEIENIKTDLELFAHTKNQHSYSRKARLDILLTPKLDKAFVKVAPPAYTGIKADEKQFEFKNIKALAGSRMQFRIRSNRPLREGRIDLVKSATDVQRIAMVKSGENEVTASLDAREAGRLRFSLIDIDGIASDETWEGSLTVTHDLPPEVQVSNPPKDCFVAMDFSTEALIEASDDYGVKMVRLHRALNQVYSPPKIVPYESIIRNSRETLMFAFNDLGVKPGDTISFFAEAIDTAPEANLARSQTVNLNVISEEDYNAFLRQQNDLTDIQAKYTELLNQFQDLIEQQKKMSEAVQKLQEKLAKVDPKQKEAMQQNLDALAAEQNELNKKLNQAADRMEKFVRKKPVYDVEADLQKILAEKAKQIRESTGANDQAMQNVMKQSSPQPGQRALNKQVTQDFKNASDEQVQRLAGTQQQAQKEVMETLQDMSLMQEIMKDFNRFESLFQTQQALTEQVQAYNRSTPLNREDQLALKNLAATEQAVAQELKSLENKLREDAKKAEKLFPKAAASAEKLASQINKQRLNPMAQQATGTMLAGNGENSYQLSERLRSEMEKMFGECKSEGGGMSNELDNYMSLSKSMNPGKNFQQMMQCRKFGNGKGEGEGMGIGMGMGQMGSSGYAVTAWPSMDVLGGEMMSAQGDATMTQSSNGAGKGKPGDTRDGVNLDKEDVVKGVKPVKRTSEAVTSESLIEEYSDIVDKYFKAITK